MWADLSKAGPESLYGTLQWAQRRALMVQWDTCGVASAIHEVLKWPVANRVASLGLFCNAGILNYLISKCLPVLMSHNSAIHKKAFIKNSFIWIHWQEASFQIANIQKKANRDVILNFLFFFFTNWEQNVQKSQVEYALALWSWS